jgi:PAS domain S-box-containing protein/putative nucleotidyltransferase with HDIG domain
MDGYAVDNKGSSGERTMRKKALIVDDNSANLYMLESLLKGYGLEVTSAKNGKEALDKARLNPPDIIVADILMPVMDGFTLCRQWKSEDQLKHIPFTFYTATYTDPKDEDFALSLGADRFIIKPQEPEILMNIFKEVLEEKYTAKQVVAKPLGEEMESFRRHNAILFNKLEKKMLDLEIANQKLRIMEENYRLSFENVSDVIYMIGTDLNIISVSPSVESMLGYKPQDFIGRPASELGYIFTPESFGQAMADLSLVLRGDTIPATIYQLIAKDGTIKHGEFSGSPLMREGKIIGIISVARDITDRKRAEEKVRESEKKYRELYDFLPIPVYEMDLDANLTAANRAIYETFRGTEEDLKKGFNAWRLLSPESIDRSRKNIQRMLKGEQIEGTEYTFKRLDGSVFPAIVISSVIYSHGKPVGLRGAIVDITERRKAEEDLRRMNVFLDSIIENIPNMIFLKDAGELRFIRFNRAGEDLLGYSRGDLLEKNDYDFFPKEQAEFFTKKDREVLFGKVVADIPEEPIQTRNKGERILHTKKVPILDAKGEPEYLLGISEDITERKKTEDMLRQTLESLKRAVGVTIQVMVSAVEARDPYTSGHQIRVADLACAIATEMKLSRDQIEAIRLAASIHDIGKLSIPAEILSRTTKLTDIEFSMIKEHPKTGYEILKDVESPWRLAEIVYQHHERMNGSGYPRNLKGDGILIEARILAVADVVEAMSSHRPYRPSLGSDVAMKEIENKRGILYDIDVADACLRLFRENGYRLPEKP